MYPEEQSHVRPTKSYCFIFNNSTVTDAIQSVGTEGPNANACGTKPLRATSDTISKQQGTLLLLFPRELNLITR